MDNISEGTLAFAQSDRFYDNSMLENWRRCKRSYYFHNIRDWVPEYTSHNLITGLCWHSAMDVVWLNANGAVTDQDLLEMAMAAFDETWKKYYPEELDMIKLEELYPKTPGRSRDMLLHYIQKRRKVIASYEVLGIELPFIVPISKEDNGIYYIGRNDKVIRKQEDMRIYTTDHKTTKSGKDVWINTFDPNNQIDGYNFAGIMTYGQDFAGVQIDGALFQKGSQKNHFDPSLPIGMGFPQHIIRAVSANTESWLWDTTYEITALEMMKEMLADCKESDPILRAYPKSTTACGYYSGCIYRGICKFIQNPLREENPPVGFKVEHWEPFSIMDVTKLVGDPQDE